MLTTSEAFDLIEDRKMAKGNSTVIQVDLGRVNSRIDLVSTTNPNIHYDVRLFNKNVTRIKLSCHFMHRTIPLLRVDYGGSAHKNPEKASLNVPDFLLPYLGIRIEHRVPHVHLYVEGDELEWAIPIQDYVALPPSSRKLPIVFTGTGVPFQREVINNFCEVIKVITRIDYLTPMVS